MKVREREKSRGSDETRIRRLPEGAGLVLVPAGTSVSTQLPAKRMYLGTIRRV